MQVTALKRFYDREARRFRNAGDVFDATEERAGQISSTLPGYIEFERPVAAPSRPPITASKVRLAEFAKSLGIKGASKMNKAQLDAAIDEALSQ